MKNVFLLPIHQLPIHHLQGNMYNINKVKLTIVTARNKASCLQWQVEPHERVSYKFCHIVWEVSILAYSMKNVG